MLNGRGDDDNFNDNGVEDDDVDNDDDDGVGDGDFDDDGNDGNDDNEEEEDGDDGGRAGDGGRYQRRHHCIMTMILIMILMEINNPDDYKEDILYERADADAATVMVVAAVMVMVDY